MFDFWELGDIFDPFQRLFFIAQFANKLKFIPHKITIHKTYVSPLRVFPPSLLPQKINSGPNFEFMLPSCRWWHNSAKTSSSDIDSKSKRLTDLELRVESRLERLSARNVFGSLSCDYQPFLYRIRWRSFKKLD